MRFVATPSQLSRKARFYEQLSQLTTAGLPIIRTLETIAARPPARSFRPPIQGVIDCIHSGSGFADALRAQPGFLPEFDLALIQAGEISGTLDRSFRMLAEHYAERARLAGLLIGGLLYPLFLLHFAVLIFPFPKLFLTGDTLAYLRTVFTVLGPLYLILLLAIVAGQSSHGLGWRSLMERLVNSIPLVGSGRRALVISRFSAALGALLNAGVTVVEAWEIAARSSGSPRIVRVVNSWVPQLRHGATPAELINASRVFPEVFSSQYAAGEISGSLDDSLARMQRYYGEEGKRKLQAVAEWTPRIAYLIIVVVIAIKIIQFWANYFGQIGEVLG